jgi:uncharacterized protein YlaI
MQKSTLATFHEKQMVPDYLFGCQGICTYCGYTANTIDHVIPVSFFDGRIVRAGAVRSKGVRTYACSDCNTVLSNKYFESFRKRCQYINQAIARRYKGILNLPVWTPEEFAELGKNFRSKLAEKMNLKAIVLERIRWQTTNEFDEYCKEPRDYFKANENVVNIGWMREYFA